MTKCRCGKELVPVFSPTESQFEDATHLTVGGGYGMFRDDLENGCKTEVFLCHDCSVDLYRMLDLPLSMLHPYEGDVPCCGWSWAVREGWLLDGRGERIREVRQ